MPVSIHFRPEGCIVMEPLHEHMRVVSAVPVCQCFCPVPVLVFVHYIAKRNPIGGLFFVNGLWMIDEFPLCSCKPIASDSRVGRVSVEALWLHNAFTSLRTHTSYGKPELNRTDRTGRLGIQVVSGTKVPTGTYVHCPCFR